MNLFEPYPPADFDQFWQETSAHAHDVDLDYTRHQNGVGEWPGFRVSTFEFRGITGERLHGWIAAPLEIEKAPAFLWPPPYGRESLLPNKYGTRKGFVSISLNFFGHGAFHQEKYTPTRGYFADGVQDKDTWIFRRMFQNCVLALRILNEQPEVEQGRIGAMGMSQGAGLSIWLGAHSPLVKAVCADMPFLGAMRYALSRNAYRYPLKELIDFAEARENGMETLLETISYYDTLNQATRCKVPVHLTMGMKDPAVRPETAEAIYEALPGKEVLRRYEIGHDWHPDMVENNRQWLLEHL